MHKLVYIALGGAIGSLARYGVGRAALFTLGAAFPYGTLIVNIVGSFLIGLGVHVLPREHDLSFLLITGFLGGFTTFSAFSVETLGLLRSPQPLQGVLYIALSLGLSLIAVYLGAVVKANV